jgi:hypothetical protein
MLQNRYQAFQDFVFAEGDRLHRPAVAALLILGAALIALFVGMTGPLLALAAAVALVAGLLVLNDTRWGFVAVVGVAFVLPFASLPFSIGFKPTFLDAALGAIFFVWLFKLVIGQQDDFVASPIGLFVGLFALLAVFSFVNGLSHSPASTFLIRRFGEILIGIALFFVCVNTVRTEEDAGWVTRWVLLMGGLAGVIAVLFYAFPDQAVWTLDRLARFDYPGGYGALRYVEDDPALGLRAIGTAVDPNVLGGMMILVAGLAAPQLFVKERLFPLWLIVGIFAAAALALYLTKSRSALLGLGASLSLLAVLKYRRLIPLGIVAVLLLILLPQTQDYVARFMAGIRGEDLATQMRFGEYKDALILIGRYPIFGVGFTGTPDLDIYLGVSMLYLIIPQNMGLVGLAVFIAAMVGFFVMIFTSWRHGYTPGMEAMLLGYAGAVLGALVSGVFDHYWFNMTYPHMTVLFWLYLGMATAVMLVQKRTLTVHH